jgi:cysteine synthase
LVVVEGVGAGRREASGFVDHLVWVQADQREARTRSLARVGSPGGPSSAAALQAWMEEEVPFLDHERPWERAYMVVCGTPEIPWDPDTELVVGASPLLAS